MIKLCSFAGFKHHRCEDLMSFFAKSDNKLNIFKFWTVSQTQQATGMHLFTLWEIRSSLSLYFSQKDQLKKRIGRFIKNNH